MFATKRAATCHCGTVDRLEGSCILRLKPCAADRALESNRPLFHLNIHACAMDWRMRFAGSGRGGGGGGTKLWVPASGNDLVQVTGC